MTGATSTSSSASLAHQRAHADPSRAHVCAGRRLHSHPAAAAAPSHVTTPDALSTNTNTPLLDPTHHASKIPPRRDAARIGACPGSGGAGAYCPLGRVDASSSKQGAVALTLGKAALEVRAGCGAFIVQRQAHARCEGRTTCTQTTVVRGAGAAECPRCGAAQWRIFFSPFSPSLASRASPTVCPSRRRFVPSATQEQALVGHQTRATSLDPFGSRSARWYAADMRLDVEAHTQEALAVRGNGDAGCQTYDYSTIDVSVRRTLKEPDIPAGCECAPPISRLPDFNGWHRPFRLRVPHDTPEEHRAREGAMQLWRTSRPIRPVLEPELRGRRRGTHSPSPPSHTIPHARDTPDTSCPCTAGAAQRDLVPEDRPAGRGVGAARFDEGFVTKDDGRSPHAESTRRLPPPTSTSTYTYRHQRTAPARSPEKHTSTAYPIFEGRTRSARGGAERPLPSTLSKLSTSPPTSQVPLLVPRIGVVGRAACGPGIHGRELLRDDGGNCCRRGVPYITHTLSALRGLASQNTFAIAIDARGRTLQALALARAIDKR
ncbi:hypothetical protein DFH06DRAFT_1146592 [Mycena polygramma]|nr:hypothetical protein DFH06DRAFT_1146592 [Mycena polygramma]